MIEFLKKHGRTLLEILGLLGLVLSLLQYRLQQQQFLFDQSLRPSLEYSHRLALSDEDRKLVTESANQLTEDFYQTLYSYKEENSVNYVTAMQKILPISKFIDAKPISVIVTLNNNGTGTATKVRVFAEIGRPITNVSIASLEPYTIVKGGIGESSISIEIDRIVAGKSVAVTIDSNRVETASQSDQLILEYNGGNDFPDYSSLLDSLDNLPLGRISIYDEHGREIMSINKEDLAKSVNDSNSSIVLTRFPVIRYLPAEQPSVSITVTSNEGNAIVVTPSP